MRVFVLYGRKSSPSAKALHLSLKEGSDYTFIRGTTASKFLGKYDYDYVINVGNSVPYRFKKTTKIINNPRKIAVSANKKLARIRFQTKKVPAPKLWLKVESIPKNEYPVVGRTTYHMKAKGFWFCKNRSEALLAKKQGATHFMKFVKNTREFRAHVFSTKMYPGGCVDYIVAKLVEKRSVGQAKSSVIKNHDNGYKFLQPDKRFPVVLNKVREVARKAIYEFGLHYGGVDVMYSKDTKRVYVLEINTSPSLTDETSNTLSVYTDKLLSMIEND